MATTPEGRVKKAVREYLVSIGCQPAGGKPVSPCHGWFYFPVQNGMGVVGIPDIVGCYKGQFFAIETKAPGKKHNVSRNQKLRLQELDRAGAVAIVADGVEDVRKCFEEAFGVGGIVEQRS